MWRRLHATCPNGDIFIALWPRMPCLRTQAAGIFLYGVRNRPDDVSTGATNQPGLDAPDGRASGSARSAGPGKRSYIVNVHSSSMTENNKKFNKI